MNKLIKGLSLIIIMFCLSGCVAEEELESNQVYTTIYPLQYLTSYLYGKDKVVTSIYPNGADINNYELTQQRLDTYAKGFLFVYNGITNEKEIAKNFLARNKKILLIDASLIGGSSPMSYKQTIEELWLIPTNYIMLAKNIKENLLNYTTSKIVKENIETNFKELEETLSYMDADLRNIALMALEEGNKTLVVSSSKLSFLKNYGFDIIDLSDKNININALKNSFQNSENKDIYLCDTDEVTSLITDLQANYKANIINVNMMYTLTDELVANNENYLTIMRDFIDAIRNTTLG